MAGINDFIRKICVQSAVHWANPTSDGYGGTKYDKPVEIKVRWEDAIQIQTGADSKDYAIKASLLSTTELYEGDMVYLGTIKDLPINTHPRDVQGAYEIKFKEKTPMIKSKTIFVSKYYLSTTNK